MKGACREEETCVTSRVEKRDLILQYDEQFAFALSREVLKTPKLSWWTIFIPIILLYHIFQHRKVVDGRKGFTQSYLISRKRALEESLALVDKGMRPDIDAILRESALPEKAWQPFRELFALLLEHYADLLRSGGSDMVSLIRSAYKSRTNYLLFLNRLNQAEKDLNKALRPHMDEGTGEIDDVMKTMERSSESLRRQSADLIFA